MTEEPHEEEAEKTPEPEPIPPPPLQQPVDESLAERVQRQAHEVPDSQNPTDEVPNRPNIRPPGVPETSAPEPPDPQQPQGVVIKPAETETEEPANP